MKNFFSISFILFTFLFSEICDLNNDDSLNIVDIVIMVNSIINDGEEFCDMNGDGELNVVDIVQLVNTILYGFNIEFINIEEGPYRVPGSNEILNLDYNYRIGKYEITNQQYLSYLNTAIANNQIWLDNCIDSIGEECVNGIFLDNDQNIEKSFFVLGNPRNYEINDYNFGIINWNGNEFEIEDAFYLDHPVINVSWFGANHFAEYNGFRLPNYNEWIKAARGETNSSWPWGGGGDMHLKINVLNSQYNTPEEFEYPWPDGTTPVGFYNVQNNMIDNASSFGVYDMIGNAWEWINEPAVFNDNIKKSMGGAWDWGLYNSRLKWISLYTTGQPTWSTGFRVVQDN